MNLQTLTAIFAAVSFVTIPTAIFTIIKLNKKLRSCKTSMTQLS